MTNTSFLLWVYIYIVLETQTVKHMAIPISAKHFAEFVLGSPSRQSTTVRNLQKPKTADVIMPISYYKRAIGIIRDYHDQGNDYSVVLQGVKSLHQDSEMAEKSQTRVKLRLNLHAVESYMKKFANRSWKVVRCPKCYYISSGVQISGKPDLAVQDSNRIRLVKLGIRKQKETEELIRLMLRAMYQAAKTKLAVKPEDITYFDVGTGNAISGDSSDRNLAKTIESGCQLLSRLMEPKQ